MISEDQWINLPVGENLMDHPNVRAAPYLLSLADLFQSEKKADRVCRPKSSSSTLISSSTTTMPLTMTLSRLMHKAILVKPPDHPLSIK